MKTLHFTFKQFNEKYPDDNACLHEIFSNKYSGVKVCPKCGKKFKYYKVNNRKCYSCAFCSHQIHPLAGTIFHKSSTSLKDWFYAIFLFSCSKNGVSGKELERQLGVTYKTAWRMAKQIRMLFDEDVEPLQNIVEIDETYVGGKEANKHKHKKTIGNQGRSTKTKVPVVGAVERNANIIAKVVTDVRGSTIKPFIKENIRLNSHLKTDEYAVYRGVDKLGYSHEAVDHGKKMYVVGEAHTNTLEGFWSQLKRSINGTYHFVSPKYLQSYVNEFSYRFNKRNSAKPIFHHLIERV